MQFDEREVKSWVQPTPEQLCHWRMHWNSLMDMALWEDLKSTQLGAMGKFRKRVLDLGEKIRSYTADRGWIPHPREQIKNCLSSGLQLRESLDKVQESIALLDGGGALVPLRSLWDTLAGELQADLRQREQALVAMLDRQYEEEV